MTRAMRFVAGMLGVAVGCLSFGAAYPAGAATPAPAWVTEQRINAANLAHTPRQQRLLADGTYMVVSAEGMALVASNFDAYGTLQRNRAWYPPVYQVNAVAIDPFGDVIVGGTSTEHNADVWVMKYDGTTGQPLWPAPFTYNGVEDGAFDGVSAVAIDAAGDVLVAGLSQTYGNNSLAVYKLSGVSGALIWGPALDSVTGSNMTMFLRVDGSGNVVVAANLTQASALDPESSDVLTVKHSGASGGLLWRQVFTGFGAPDYVQGLAVSRAGDVAVVVQSVNGTTYGSDFTITTLEYSSYGSLKWGPKQMLGNSRRPVAKAIAFDALGDVFVSAAISNGANDDFVTVKYSGSNGAVAWGPVRYAGSAGGADTPGALAIDGAGNVLVAGSSWDGVNASLAGIKYDGRSGSALWGPTVLDGASSQASGMSLDVAGNVLVVGTKTVPGAPATSTVWKQDGATGSSLWSPAMVPHGAGISDIPVAGATDAAGDAIVLVQSSNGSDTDFGLFKVSGATGALVWGPVVFDGPSHLTDRPIALAVDGAGNAAVTGTMKMADGSYQWATLKYSGASGALMWGPMTIASAFTTQPTGVAVDVNGDVFVAGITSTGSLTRSLTLVKYAGTNGAALWGPLTSGTSDEASMLALDAAGNVLVAGNTYSGGSHRPRIWKVNGATGQSLWNAYASAATPYTYSTYAIALDSSSDVYLVAQSTPGIYPNYTDIVTYKFAGTTGAQVWGPKTYDNSYHSDDTAKQILVDSSGVYVVGTTNVSTGYAFVALKYDRNSGNLIWGPSLYSAVHNADLVAAALNRAGNLVAVGTNVVADRWSTDLSVAEFDGGTGAVSSLVFDMANSESARFVTPVGGDVLVGATAIPSRGSGKEHVLLLRATDGLAIQTLTLPAARCGQAYDVPLQAVNGNGPLFWSLVTGSLPAGLTLTSGGEIAGTPATTGVAMFRVNVTDGSATAERVFILSVTEGASWLSIATTPNPVCQGGTTTLSAPQGYSSYLWLPNHETGSTISVAPQAPGTYALLAIDSSGCSRRGAIDVGVYGSTVPTPVITASGSTTFCQGGSVVLTSSGTGTYRWSTGETTRAITVTVSGSYSVTVADAGGCFATSDVTVVTVNPSPAVAVTTASSVCGMSAANTASVADAGQGATYAWGITNGTITAGAGTPSITYTAGQAGTVGLSVTVQPADSCSSGAVAAVAISPLPAVDFLMLSSFCPGDGESVSVPNAGPNAVYYWTVTNGTPQTTGNSPDFTFRAGQSGQLTVSVTVVVGSCSASHSATATISAVPVAAISSAAHVCAGGTGVGASVPDAGPGATYTWTIENGAITSGAGTSTITFNVTGTGNLILDVVVQNASGCSARSSWVALIHARPTVQITAPSGACSNQAYLQAATTAGDPWTVYTWSITNGTITGGQGYNSISFQVGASGTATLSVTAQNAPDCSASASANIDIAPIPSAQVTAPTSVCASSTGTASVPDAGVGATYVWTVTNGTLVSGAGTRAITFSPGPSGSVALAVTVQSGPSCAASGSASVYITPLPPATITAPASICAGATGFASAPYPAGSYSWSITNGTITSQSLNAITFVAGASGPVTLNVTVTSAGCSSSSSKDVPVTPAPSAAIAAPASMCSGATAAASIGDAGAGASYSWTITNGTITSGAGTRSIAFSPSGTAPVTLGVTVQSAASCSDSGSATVTVNPQPVATISVANAICANSTGNTAAVPDGGPGTTYTWGITNGTITSGAGSRAITFIAGPSGGVALTVGVQSGAACSANGSANISVMPVPSATITAPAALCAGGSGAASVPDAGAGAAYNWSITNGSITSGAGTRAIAFTPTGVAPVTLSITVTSSGCSSSGSASVAVSALPDATLTAPDAACAGSAGLAASTPDAGAGATYTWTIVNGTITSGAGSRAITFTAGAVGTTTLGVTVMSAAGCSSTSGKNVSVGAIPVSTISAPAALCPNGTGTTSVADAGAGATYAWTMSGGTITSGAGTPSLAFTAGTSGSVSLGVTVTSAAGCSSSSSATTIINALASATVTAPGTVCASSTGNSASVADAGVGATYTWSISGGTITAGTGTRTITWTAGTSSSATISVTVTNATGCSASGGTAVAIAALPSAAITAASSVRKNSTNNTASVPSAGTGATYTWSISNGKITSGAGTANIRYTAGVRGTLTLNVTVRSSAGCTSTGMRSVSVTN